MTYTATAIVLGKKFTAKGKTVDEAIGKLDIKGKGKLILSVSNGEKTKERVYMPFMVARLTTGSPQKKEIVVKQVSDMFRGL